MNQNIVFNPKAFPIFLRAGTEFTTFRDRTKFKSVNKASYQFMTYYHKFVVNRYGPDHLVGCPEHILKCLKFICKI